MCPMIAEVNPVKASSAYARYPLESVLGSTTVMHCDRGGMLSYRQTGGSGMGMYRAYAV